MTTIVSIPGGTATLRDPADLTERGRRLIVTSIIAMQGLAGKMPASVRKAAERGDEVNAALFISSRLEAAAMLELSDAAVVALLKDWSLDEPLPTIDTLLDLDRDVLDALQKGAGPFIQDVIRAAMPTNFAPQDPTGDNPFDESATSERGLKVVANGSSGKRRNTGASTSTAATSGLG